jgi:hypothetical protein
VSCVLSVVLLGRDTGIPHLLAPNLLTGGKGADLVIRGDVVVNGYKLQSPVKKRARNAVVVILRRLNGGPTMLPSNQARI